jgi:hypothetical protein
MKYLLLLSVVFFASCANIMNNPQATAEQKRSQFIVEHQGMMKDQLYSQVMKAMGVVYKSSETVIEVSDREGGNIVGNGAASIETTCKGGVFTNMPFNVRYKIVITIKDGKVRYQYSPSIVKMGTMSASDCSAGSECEKIFTYMSEAECFWTPMGTYFQTVTDQITKIVNEKDDF